jgi:hypothetical protein
VKQDAIAKALHTYQSKELGFGIRAEDLKAIMGRSMEEARTHSQVFDNGSGTYVACAVRPAAFVRALGVTRVLATVSWCGCCACLCDRACSINALDFICGAAICCKGGVTAKADSALRVCCCAAWRVAQSPTIAIVCLCVRAPGPLLSSFMLLLLLCASVVWVTTVVFDAFDFDAPHGQITFDELVRAARSRSRLSAALPRLLVHDRTASAYLCFWLFCR